MLYSNAHSKKQSQSEILVGLKLLCEPGEVYELRCPKTAHDGTVSGSAFGRPRVWVVSLDQGPTVGEQGTQRPPRPRICQKTCVTWQFSPATAICWLLTTSPGSRRR